MQYPEAAAPAGVYCPVIQPVIVADPPEVSRTRQKLMILIGIVFTLGLVGNIGSLVGVIGSNGPNRSQYAMQYGQSLLYLMYYGFGLRAAQKYHQTGLRVFAWLGIIGLCAGAILLVIIIIGVATLVGAAHKNTDSTAVVVGISVGAIVVSVLWFISAIVTIIIINWARKLARLIDASKQLPIAASKI